MIDHDNPKAGLSVSDKARQSLLGDQGCEEVHYLIRERLMTGTRH